MTAAMVTGQYVDPAAGRVTVREYVERWRTTQVLRPTTAAHVETMLRRHVYPTLGDKRLGSVLPSDVQSLVKQLSLDLAPATVGVVHRILAGVFKSAASALGVLRAHQVGLAAQWRTLAVAAVAVAVYPLAFHTSMRLAGVAIGTVVSIGSAPIAAALIERVIDGRPLSRRWALGATVGVLGVLALAFAHPGEGAATSTSGSKPVLGIALGLLAGVTYALYSWAAARTMSRGLPSRPVMGAIFGAGGVLLLPVLLLTGAPIVAAWPNFAAVAYLALVPMFLGYVLFGRGVAAVPASTATSLSLLEPAVAAVIAVIVLQERLPALGWFGMGIVLASLLITVAPRRPATDTENSPSTSPSRAVEVVS